MKLLVVEDEKALSQGLKFNFEQEGYTVLTAEDGPTALNYFRECYETDQDNIDLVILDLMLPGMSGYEIAKEIRRIDEVVPILVLSARELSEDKAYAFDCGTDQYMTKPFALPELLSRVKNLLKRKSLIQPVTNTSKTLPALYHFGNVTVDFESFEIEVGEERKSLTNLELRLLKYFIEHEGMVLTRSQILEDVWGEQSAYVTTRTIDNFVLRLRKLVETNPAEPVYIVSVRGAGYRFMPEESSE
ncbi:response regulator transcription factor [Gimesia aquarii]|uniref:Alkaline phosphatase synthesis transcriptional regulatory protein SphR n=1 Tax=Gimesia aquarii TaxID=2527964 RepID=A0A517VXG6_9PLAN|nr:response regulator transcription factor [Gimesia aquarii]QDT97695.1 Alkaline phosphatase synthesis transcriptional regulatory protein SphR [Gimesia aquarii]